MCDVSYEGQLYKSAVDTAAAISEVCKFTYLSHTQAYRHSHSVQSLVPLRQPHWLSCRNIVFFLLFFYFLFNQLSLPLLNKPALCGVFCGSVVHKQWQIKTMVSSCHGDQYLEHHSRT